MDFGSSMGGWVDIWNESFQKAKDQVNSAWFMNENQKQQGHMFDRGLAAESSAMQRRVRDLEQAGLNPLLAIRGGDGAGSPGSGSASGGSAMSGSARANFAAATAQAKLVEAQALQLRSSSALQAAETKKVLDTLPELIRSLRGEAARKEFGKSTVEKSEQNMEQFWKFLERLGGRVGASAFEYHQKAKDPLDVMHGENREKERELSPAGKEWRAKRRRELYGKE